MDAAESTASRPVGAFAERGTATVLGEGAAGVEDVMGFDGSKGARQKVPATFQGGASPRTPRGLLALDLVRGNAP